MPGATTREELVASYAHPYRRWLPVAYRTTKVVHVGVAAAGLAAPYAVLEALTDADLAGLQTLVWILVAAAILRFTWVTIAAGRTIHAHTRDWSSRHAGELGRLRERRPHATEADRVVAHDEYAVEATEDGELVTWCFVALRSNEDPAERETLVAGTPRYAARPVDRLRYDAVDAARAAEQLADAQAHAADRERAAAERAHAEVEERARARELLAETRSTGAALRRQTGQAD